MPSEAGAPQRQHPASLLFNLAGDIKYFAVPAILFLVGGSGERWQAWGLLLIVPSTIGAIVGYLTFTYTYGEDELIIREGLFFRNERHIPYSRIQNIDATQNIVHALFRVYAVALETGSGAQAEATLQALPEAALTEMRRRIFARRAEQTAEHSATDAAAAPDAASAVAQRPAAARGAGDVLLRLSLRDLAVCGLVRGRGLLLLGAIVGLGFEMGLDDRIVTTAENPEARGPIAQAVRALIERASFDLVQIAAGAALLVAVVLILRLFSVVYTMQRLFGFTLTHDAGELRMSYGLLTRVRATIPIRRIQTVTVREGPLHRLFRVTSVRADTAGGEANEAAAGSREWLAPVLAAGDTPAFVARLLPGCDLDAVDWHRAHPRAPRRASVRPLFAALVISAGVAWYVGAAGLLFLPVAAGIAIVIGRKTAAHLAHGVAGDRFFFRSGWIWRHTTIAPIEKVQVVRLAESPFDRRQGMASLVVDTAGAAGAPHRLQVPYLPRDRAAALSSEIGARAARTALSW